VRTLDCASLLALFRKSKTKLHKLAQSKAGLPGGSGSGYIRTVLPAQITEPRTAPLVVRVASFPWEKLVFALGFLAGLGWLVTLWLRSPGTLLDDEIGHLLISRDAWGDPRLILSVWGRPLNTLVYMPAALQGLALARFTSVVLAVVTAVLTVLTARHLGLRTVFLVPVLLFFQPWFAETGYMALTQAPLMCLMILAVYAALRRWWLWLGLVLGLLPLVRHEALALAGLGFIYLAWHRQWRAVAICVLPMVAYNVAHLLVYGQPAAGHLLDVRPTTEYGSGTWWHFWPALRYGVGWSVLLGGALGVWALRRGSERWGFVWWYAAFILLHTVIYRFGLFASGGYGVFIQPTAPLFALLAAKGLDAAMDWSGKARTWICAVAAAGTMTVGLFAKPQPLYELDAAMIKTADWLQQEAPGATVVARHVWFLYACRLPMPSQSFPNDIILADLPVGSFAVWDEKYADKLGLPLTVLRSATGDWVERRNEDNRVLVFQKVAR